MDAQALPDTPAWSRPALAVADDDGPAPRVRDDTPCAPAPHRFLNTPFGAGQEHGLGSDSASWRSSSSMATARVIGCQVRSASSGASRAPYTNRVAKPSGTRAGGSHRGDHRGREHGQAQVSRSHGRRAAARGQHDDPYGRDHEAEPGHTARAQGGHQWPSRVLVLSGISSTFTAGEGPVLTARPWSGHDEEVQHRRPGPSAGTYRSQPLHPLAVMSAQPGVPEPGRRRWRAGPAARSPRRPRPGRGAASAR